jgi:hypothetical protein
VRIIADASVRNLADVGPCELTPGLPTQALFWLSCLGADPFTSSAVADLTSIAVSGPCAGSDAAVMNEAQAQAVYVSSPSPGVCHVELTFATGFTYTTDVTFESMTFTNCGTTATFIGPTQTVFDVDNPSDTCGDAGFDAAVLYLGADAATDAPSEAALDAQADGDRIDAGCTPITCVSLGNTCGPQSDGCGGLVGPCVNGALFPVDAGPVCNPPEYCGGGGFNTCGVGPGGTIVCIQDLCVPITCAAIDCGPAGDGCGGLLECGSCPFSDESCVDNECVWPADAGPCVPATCEGLGYDCGVLSDGCGGHLDCGTCPVGQFCGGGGVHLCGGTCDTPDGGPCEIICSSDAGGSCIGQSCQGGGHACGQWPNGCGGLLECGPCGGDAGTTDAGALDAQADTGDE